MKNIKKIFIFLFLVLFTSFGLYSQETKYGVIYTQTDFLDESDFIDLYVKAITCGEKYNCGIYIAVIDSLSGFGYDDIYSGAENFYKDIGLGVGENNDGILLLLSLEEEEFVFYSSGTKGYGVFDDDILQDLVNKFSESCEREDNIVDCFNYIISVEENYLAKAESSLINNESSGITNQVTNVNNYDYIDVESELLSENQLLELNNLAEKYSKLHDCGIYVRIIDDMRDFGYTNIESCSEFIYKSLNLGLGEDSNGVLLLLSLADRDYDICAYGIKGHYSFTNYGKKQIFNDMKYNLKNNNWNDALTTFIKDANYYLQVAEDGNPIDTITYENTKRTFKSEDGNMNYGLIILISVCIAFIIALIVCFVLRAPMKNVKIAKQAVNYVISGGISFTVRNDHYSHRTTTRVKINNDSSNSGGTSISRGGFSHSSGKF